MAVLIGLWVLPRTWTLLSESINILLEGVPKGISVVEIREALSRQPRVQGVHDLHVWEVASGKISMTAHVVHAPDGEPQKLLEDLQEVVRSTFDIHHTTFQLETAPCWIAGEAHAYRVNDPAAAGAHMHGAA